MLFNQGAKLVQTECTAKEKACFFICSAEVPPNLGRAKVSANRMHRLKKPVFSFAVLRCRLT